MHRGTTIEDAGYKVGTSWPIVPDIKDAQDGKRYIKYTLIAAVPAMAVAFLILMASGVAMPMTLIGPAVVLAAITFIIIRFHRLVHSRIVNCKMVKVIADLADTDVEFTGKTVFEAVNRRGDTERIVQLNEQYGVYVNAGYRMDDGRTELPYIIFITKVPQNDDSVAA